MVEYKKPIDKRKPPYVATPPPENMSTIERQRFFDKKYTQWVNGVNGLTGKHVAYLDFGTLKALKGQVARPNWRDGDMEIFHNMEAAISKKDDELYVKRRRYGASSLFGGFLPVYECLMNPGSVSLMTSADSPRVKLLFNEKLMPMYNGLESFFGDLSPKKHYERSGGYLNLIGSDGTPSTGSKVICIETSDSDLAAKKMEGYSATLVIIDEAFLSPRAEMVVQSAQPCLYDSDQVKEGHLIICGSCGAEKPEEAATLRSNSFMIERMWRDADKIGLRTMFLPAWLCVFRVDELDDDGNKTGKVLTFSENGYSNKEKVTSWILKTREKLKKAGNPERLQSYTKSFPLTIEEVFDSNRRGILDPAIYDALSEAKVKTHEEGGEKKYSLYRDSNGSVSRKEVNTGLFVITKEPQFNKTYIGGIDPLPFNSTKIEDGSEYSFTIKCFEDQEYVALYTERSLNSDQVIKNCILLQEYFKSAKFPYGAPAMVETNAGGVVMKTYRDLGKWGLLADVPKKVGKTFIDAQVSRGWSNNLHSGPIANDLYIKYLEKYAATLRILRLIEGSAIFPIKSDPCDAMKATEVFDAQLVAEMKKKQGGGEKHPIYLRYLDYDENGRVVYKEYTTFDESGR